MYISNYTRVGGCTEAPSGTNSTSMTTIMISGLEENIEYEFTLTAINYEGTSSPATYTITTLSAGKILIVHSYYLIILVCISSKGSSTVNVRVV